MKTMVITGAASGLGLALAQRAAQQGWSVMLADINTAGGEQAAADIRESGGNALFHMCDVGQTESFESLLQATLEHFGQVDVLVNNAGVASAGFLTETTEAVWQRLIELNLLSCVRGTRTFLPALQQAAVADRQHPVAVVNVASLAALMLAPGMISYNVVKAAVLAFSESLRAELAGQGVHVVAACPGFFKTNLVSSMQGVNAALKDRIESWMTHSGFTADDVACDILDALQQKRFLLLSDRQSKRLDRMRRWFPAYFYKIKLKRTQRMMQASEQDT